MGQLGVAMKRTHVVLPDELLADVDSLVGPRGRSAFLTEVVREAVGRARLLRVLGGSEAVLKTDDYPEFRDGSDAWVRQLREEDQALDRERIGTWLANADVL